MRSKRAVLPLNWLTMLLLSFALTRIAVTFTGTTAFISGVSPHEADLTYALGHLESHIGRIDRRNPVGLRDRGGQPRHDYRARGRRAEAALEVELHEIVAELHVVAGASELADLLVRGDRPRGRVACVLVDAVVKLLGRFVDVHLIDVPVHQAQQRVRFRT